MEYDKNTDPIICSVEQRSWIGAHSFMRVSIKTCARALSTSCFPLEKAQATPTIQDTSEDPFPREPQAQSSEVCQGPKSTRDAEPRSTPEAPAGNKALQGTGKFMALRAGEDNPFSTLHVQLESRAG